MIRMAEKTGGVKKVIIEWLSKDDCPIETGFSDTGRIFGCPDSDGDSYANTVDVFPDEFSFVVFQTWKTELL